MKRIVALLVLCLLLAGCANSHTERAKTVAPLPDTTMEHLTDAVLAVSLKQGGAYVDDTGKMQMDLTVYSYDRYDMAEIAALQVGDTLVRHAGSVKVTSKTQDAAGICLNGSIHLATDDSGIFYEVGAGNTKNWYPLGDVTIRVSADFKGIDSIAPERGEVTLYPGDFLVGAVTNYDFTPENTTVRVENGQIVEMHRKSN